MRKLLVLPLALLALNVLGQAPQPGQPMQQPAPPMPFGGMPAGFIVPLQTGTETLKDGKDTVKFTDQSITEMEQARAEADYTVMLTPRGEGEQIYLAETTPKYFLVKQKGSGHSQFDYVIFVKQRRPMLPPRPQRPPMAPQPAAPAPPANQK